MTQERPSKKCKRDVSGSNPSGGERLSNDNECVNDGSKSQSSSDEKLYKLLPLHGEHRRAVAAVEFSPTSSYSSYSSCSSATPSYALCASASADGTVKLWDIRQSMYDQAVGELKKVNTSSSGLQSTTLTGTNGDTENDTSLLLSVSTANDGQVGGNDASTEDNNDTAMNEAKAKNSSQGVTGGEENSDKSKNMTPISTLHGHSRGINDVAWSPCTGEVIATASDDKTLRLWDVTRAASRTSKDGGCGEGGGASGGLAGVPSTGAGSTPDHNSNNTSSPDSLVEFKGHSNFCFSVKFSPQGNLLVSGSFDETVKIWDVRSGQCISTLPAHSDPVTGVDFNRDGTCIVSSSHDGLIRVWDVATGECLKTIYAEGNPPVSFVRYSPNGRFVLSGMLDGKLRLWNVTSKFASDGDNINNGGRGAVSNGVTDDELGLLGGVERDQNYCTRDGKCTKTYAGHVNTKYCIFSAFNVANPDIRKHSIVTGSEDGKIFIYDLQSRKVRQVLEGGHSAGEAVLAVAAHSKKDLLASGGMSNKSSLVRFWAPVPSSESDSTDNLVQMDEN